MTIYDVQQHVAAITHAWRHGDLGQAQRLTFALEETLSASILDLAPTNEKDTTTHDEPGDTDQS